MNKKKTFFTILIILGIALFIFLKFYNLNLSHLIFKETKLIKDVLIIYPKFFSLLFGIFLGEESLIFLTTLFKFNGIPLTIILVLGGLGMILSDTFIFSLGKLGLIKKIKNKRLKYKELSNIHLFLLMLITKFSYGFSLVTLIYLGDRNIKYNKFLLINILINLLLVIFSITLGIMGLKGFTIFFKTFKNIQLLITLIIIIAIIYFLIKKWIDKKIKEKL